MSFLLRFAIVLALVIGIEADFPCVCNYNVEKKILDAASVSAGSMGYLYEFDCKEHLEDVQTSTGWVAIAFSHRIGYLQMDQSTVYQTCPGNPSDSDKLLPTTPVMVSTSTEPTNTVAMVTDSTPYPTTSTKTTQKQTTSTETMPVQTSSTAPEPPSTLPVSTTAPYTTTTTSTPPPLTSKMTSSTVLQTRSSTIVVTETSTTPTAKTTAQVSTTMPSTPSSTTPLPKPVTTISQQQIIAGNTSLCPSAVQHFAARDGTYLTQYDHSCYEIVSRPHTWSYAESHCRSKGGYLVHISNSNEQNFIYSVLSKHYNLKVWIGLNDLNNEGHYEWSSGDKLTYTHWVPGKMNSSQLDCVALDPRNGGLWKDEDCQDIIITLPDVYAYICQYDIVQTTPGGAANGDGNTKLCPSSVQQHALFNLGILGQHGQSCYELMPEEKITWSHGEQLCQKEGGHLAHISNAEEQSFVQSFVNRHMPHHAVWIGLTDRRNENFFEWTSGTPVTFTYWIAGHIGNFVSHHDEDCTLLVPYKNGRWDDVPCGQSMLNLDYGETHPILCQFHISTGSVIVG